MVTVEEEEDSSLEIGGNAADSESKLFAVFGVSYEKVEQCNKSSK